MIPVIFLLLLLLIQPGIILYDMTIMKSAASEGCRILATSSNENLNKICEPFIRRRLEAIPQQDNFHLHSSGCSYLISFSGDQTTEKVSVKLTNELKPLPLIGFLSDIFGLLNEKSCFEITVESSQITRADWVKNSPQGHNPENWSGGWLP